MVKHWSQRNTCANVANFNQKQAYDRVAHNRRNIYVVVIYFILYLRDSYKIITHFKK